MRSRPIQKFDVVAKLSLFLLGRLKQKPISELFHSSPKLGNNWVTVRNRFEIRFSCLSFFLNKNPPLRAAFMPRGGLEPPWFPTRT